MSPHRQTGALNSSSSTNGRRALRVAVVTNLLPHYRVEFFRRLFQRSDMEVRLFCQAAIKGVTLQVAHDRFPDHVTLVSTTGLKEDRLCWQWLPWRRLLASFDVLFVYGNPRIFSNVVLATVARVMGKSVVIAGQAHTAGAGEVAERLRLSWWRQFDNLLVYTDGEARWLRARGFNRQHIVGLNNGLDQHRIDQAAERWDETRLATWRLAADVEGRNLILSCARLEPKNRYDLWLSALPAVISRYPNALWCVIGDGSERPALETQARRLGVTEHVRWLGGIHEEEALAPWFLTSRLLVHPAGIGLTLLHAFGYGLPVVTQDAAAGQMPEFDAFEAGETGLLYRRGDPKNLADTVCRCLVDEPARLRMAARARKIARERFNVDIMVERFALIAKHAGGRG
jgi:glycosyltransferase involved in cell wall biosynthesis